MQTVIQFAVRFCAIAQNIKGVMKKGKQLMAIYHFSMKTISRSAGRTATAAAAYRAGVAITDMKTGEIHNYVYKKGVLGKGIVLPANAPKWAFDREKLWNAAEESEKRKNSTVAREIVLALPAELDGQVRERMVRAFAEKLSIRHKVAVDYALHEPNAKGDNRNYHAHLLMSTRRLTADGFTEKTRELDERKSGEVEYWREEWANHANRYLAEHNRPERISHLSLAEQGIDREPTRHKGVAATAIERKNRTAILENPGLNYMEKSRALHKLEPLRIAEPPAPSGYNFGQELPNLENIEVVEVPKLIGKGILSDEDVIELFHQAGEVAALELDLHMLMEDRSELVRQLEMQRAKEAAGIKLVEILPTLTDRQKAGLAKILKTSREAAEHLPQNDREKQLAHTMERVIELAKTAQGRAALDMAAGNNLFERREPEREEPRGYERDDDLEMGR